MANDETPPEGRNDNLNGARRPQQQPPVDREPLVTRVRALAEALEGSEVGELDLTEDGVRVVIRRQLEPTVIAPRGHPGPGPRPARSRAEDAEPAPDLGIAIVTPLTGVFYTASSPSTPPFTQVGEMVHAGQIVCIVEAMKVFNEIKSEIAGTVVAIVAQNGQLVQKGEALLRVKPA